MPFILEGLVTTQNRAGRINLAPMGPVVEQSENGEIRKFLFRPFSDSQTCKNLLEHRHGVFHATDDVLLFARAVTGNLQNLESMVTPAAQIVGARLKQACQAYEFEVTEIDDSQPRVSMHARVLQQHSGKFWGGFNRAQFAVLEAAITATRLHLISASQVALQMKELTALIEKTAGEQEQKAFLLIQEYIARQSLKNSADSTDNSTQILSSKTEENCSAGGACE